MSHGTSHLNTLWLGIYLLRSHSPPGHVTTYDERVRYWQEQWKLESSRAEVAFDRLRHFELAGATVKFSLLKEVQGVDKTAMWLLAGKLEKLFLSNE